MQWLVKGAEYHSFLPLATLHLFFAYIEKSIPSLFLTSKETIGVVVCLIHLGTSLSLLFISLWAAAGKKLICKSLYRTASMEWKEMKEVVPAFSPQENMLS